MESSHRPVTLPTVGSQDAKPPRGGTSRRRSACERAGASGWRWRCSPRPWPAAGATRETEGRAHPGLARRSSSTGRAPSSGSATPRRRRTAQVKPDVTVVVDNHGTGGGFSNYLQGEVDIVDASRAAKPDEEAKAKAQGLDWTRFLVGYDGITRRRQPEERLRQGADRRAAQGDLGARQQGQDLEGRRPVAGPTGRSSCTAPTTTRAPSSSSPRRSSARRTSQREDVQASSDDNTLVNGVAGDADGLGYFGYAYYAANTDKLRAVPVQNGPDAKPVAPSPETSSTRRTPRSPGRCTSTRRTRRCVGPRSPSS